MKVYVVMFEVEYEPSDLQKVFKNKCDAQKYCETENKIHRGHDYYKYYEMEVEE